MIKLDKYKYNVNLYYTGFNNESEIAIKNAVGHSNGSGFNFIDNVRDHIWYCKTKTKADSIAKKLKSLKLPGKKIKTTPYEE